MGVKECGKRASRVHREVTCRKSKLTVSRSTKASCFETNNIRSMLLSNIVFRSFRLSYTPSAIWNPEPLKSSAILNRVIYLGQSVSHEIKFCDYHRWDQEERNRAVQGLWWYDYNHDHIHLFHSYKICSPRFSRFSTFHRFDMHSKFTQLNITWSG